MSHLPPRSFRPSLSVLFFQTCASVRPRTQWVFIVCLDSEHWIAACVCQCPVFPNLLRIDRVESISRPATASCTPQLGTRATLQQTTCPALSRRTITYLAARFSFLSHAAASRSILRFTHSVNSVNCIFGLCSYERTRPLQASCRGLAHASLLPSLLGHTLTH